MSSRDPAAERDALATLELLRQHLDVAAFSAEDRAALAEWWAEVARSGAQLEPETASYAGISATGMLFDPSETGLATHLIPVSLAFQTFDTAIRQGLPGAEHLAEGFFRDCGFDEDTVRRLLTEMVSRAPLPDPETSN